MIDELKEQLRTNHILRLQKEKCSIAAGCVMDLSAGTLNLHQTIRAMREDRNEYAERYENYSRQFALSKT